MLTTILAFLVALGILITFHELGHYWAARRCGVRVLRFSVGFGKPLWRRVDRHGTEWVVAGIPLGGYVKMQEEPAADAMPAEQQEAFSRQPLRNRFFIVAAGPMANFILAALLYAGLGIVGTQEPAAILASPSTGSAAQLAGVQEGDRVLAVDGHPVSSWGQVRWQLLEHAVDGGDVTLSIARNDRPLDILLTLPRGNAQPDVDPLGLAGLSLAMGQPRIGNVMANGAGAAAGLREGDKVESVGQQQQPDVRRFIDVVKESAGKPLPISVLRDGALLSLTATPEPVSDPSGQTVGRLGVSLSSDTPLVNVQHGPLDSLWLGTTRTVETAWFSLKMLGRMITGDVSWKNISGPVTIADYAGQTARMGIASYIAFLALVSVSIGVLNLLPIPMLDGGHLMFYLIEMVRGKPAPERWLDLGHRAGVAVLAGLMTLAIFNDLMRLFG